MAHPENPKHKVSDGCAFGRLRAAQKLRETIEHILNVAHPSSGIFVDQVREYAGAQIVFYRAIASSYEHARVAVFEHGEHGWRKLNDIIAAQA